MATVAEHLGIRAELDRVRQDGPHAADVLAVLIECQLQCVGLLGKTVNELADARDPFARFHKAGRSRHSIPRAIRDVKVVFVECVKITSEVLIQVFPTLDGLGIDRPPLDLAILDTSFTVQIAILDSGLAMDVLPTQFFQIARIVLGGRMRSQAQQGDRC